MPTPNFDYSQYFPKYLTISLPEMTGLTQARRDEIGTKISEQFHELWLAHNESFVLDPAYEAAYQEARKPVQESAGNFLKAGSADYQEDCRVTAAKLNGLVVAAAA